MALPKPSSHIDWTDGAVSKVVEPSAAKKLLGWVALERPPFEYMNFLFFRLDEWAKYLESITDETANARVVLVDAGGNGQFTTLQAAHDSASVVAGSKILILSDLSLDSTTTISKNDIEIEMRPGTRILKGGGAAATNFTGIQVQATADRCRLKGFGLGRAGNFFNGTGDKALEIVAGAADVFIDNPASPTGNTTDIDDQGTDTVIANPQNPAA